MQTVFRNLTNFLNKSSVVQRFRIYNRIAFSPKYLLFTNVCISISLSSVGDGLEQQYELYMDELDKYSGKRTTHMVWRCLGVLQNSSREEVVAEIKNKAWKLYAAEWVVRPPAQIINFYWLPNRYRVLYDNTISLGYDVYTSKKNVIDAPIVCPVGQKPDQNGKCREDWSVLSQIEDKNVIDVPVVCPVGQKPDQNGKCRDVWMSLSQMESVS